MTIKLHGNAFQRSGLPDIMILGKMLDLDMHGAPTLAGATRETASYRRLDVPMIVFIELKAKGKAQTPLQIDTSRKMAACGHVVHVCYEVDDVVSTLVDVGLLVPPGKEIRS